VSDLLNAALAAAERGWYVFPLRPSDKRPAFPSHTAVSCDLSDRWCRLRGGHVGWEQRATRSPDRIRRAWSVRPYNVGIACGPSELLVVDLDQPKPGESIPPQWAERNAVCGADVFALICADAGYPIPADTFTVRTGRGGRHLYFRQPDGAELRNTNADRGNGLGWLVDTRGGGGYIVAAGSIVAGHRYEATYDGDPVDLPIWLAHRLRPVPTSLAASVRVDIGARANPVAGLASAQVRVGKYVAAAMRRQLTYLTSAAQGQRNTALYISAVAFGQLVAGGALAEYEAEALLKDAARQIGLGQTETAQTIVSGLRAGAKRPRRVAA
jgi:hypothetical protein